MEILHIVVRAVCEDRKVDLLIAVTGSLITADHKYAWRPGRFGW